jgi:hypothetical protein
MESASEDGRSVAKQFSGADMVDGHGFNCMLRVGVSLWKIRLAMSLSASIEKVLKPLFKDETTKAKWSQHNRQFFHGCIFHEFLRERDVKELVALGGK